MWEPVFPAILFVLARNTKQPKHPSAKEEICKLWYVHVTYYTAIENKKNPTATRSDMDNSPRNNIKKKNQTQEYMLYDSICVKFKDKEN